MEPWKQRVYASYGDSALGAGRGAHADTRAALEERQFIQRYRRLLPGDRAVPILDIGCGGGSFLTAVRALGYTAAEGIDASASQVAAAAARGVAGVSVASARDFLSSTPRRYALITAFNVLEHQTRAELFELLDAIHRALLPGGRLIAVVPNAKGLFGAHVRFADITHELSFTPTSVEQICAVTGFECVSIQEHDPLVHGPASAIRWVVWQMIRAGLSVARLAEGGDWRQRVFTQDLVFVARTPA
jgi:SAM-dependent methyltransferase